MWKVSAILLAIVTLLKTCNPYSPFSTKMGKEYVNRRRQYDRKAKWFTWKYASYNVHVELKGEHGISGVVDDSAVVVVGNEENDNLGNVAGPDNGGGGGGGVDDENDVETLESFENFENAENNDEVEEEAL